MIDLNNAEVQGTGGAGAIPEDSIVAFKMTIRPPKAGKEGNTHNLFSKSGKGNEYLDVEFEVSSGSYAGRKIWQNFTLVGSDQAAKISMRTLRAIVESARGIASSDASPQAAAGRQLSDWADFNSMVFLAKVGYKVEQSMKDGNYYINNEIKRIITLDDEEYSKGEYISDKPLPAVPATGASASPSVMSPAATAAPPNNWGSPPAPSTMVPPVGKANGGSPVPAWAQR